MLSTTRLSVTSLHCPVFAPGDPGYTAEVATFHTNTVHTPDLVVGVERTSDVADAIQFAREHEFRVSVQSGGHGMTPVISGMMITTQRMNAVTIDATARVATIGGGARWKEVLAAAEPHGLLPIIGSSSHVGVAGYLLGGGLGPLARTHGFSVDHVLGFTVVTASGDVLEVDDAHHADLFWALRGGKAAPGIVTEIRLQLFPLTTIYAGALFFEEEHIEPVFRGWLDWTKVAASEVTTSAAIMTFPDLDISPPPFRGKRVLMLRFAYPGDAVRGAELAAPLRGLAPVYIDGVGDITPTQMDLIHNDPPEPLPAWGAGAQFRDAGQELADRFLERFGAGTTNPFAMAEFRHGGGAVATDVAGGSAVTGRDATYTMFLVSMFPPLFAEIAPAAAGETVTALQPWLLPETNVNFIGENTASRPWSPAVQARLDEIRGQYDPEDIFVQRW
ncbi:MAG: FAD-binding oxidoreductase [Chloroflexota bacterium]|nr:FAD-binding oxidoreductase [Chloroflexota bacterium]